MRFNIQPQRAQSDIMLTATGALLDTHLGYVGYAKLHGLSPIAGGLNNVTQPGGNYRS